jgi:Protein of unknown function (DUF3108)
MGARRYSAVLACLLLVALVSGPSRGEPARPQAGRIVATYDAGLAGIKLGEFQVTATFAGSAYEMAAQGEFSLLAGLLYKGGGKTTSSGTLTKARPQPARYSLSYKDNKKRQQLDMTFARGAVADVKIVPQKPRQRDIPVTDEQLKNVLDPLTAAFLSVRSDAPPGDLDVCRQTIRVFDGRQRFDIVLSPKRTDTIDGDELKQLSRRTAVCRVRYQPISGYQPDHPGVQYMTKNDEVEVWLVAVPGAPLFIPYKILIPTTWGTGTVELDGLKANLGTQAAGVP